MMDRSSFRGIYVIAMTPFTEDRRIDHAGLARMLDFCLDAGVHGIVATANASEVGYLSEAERREVAEAVVRHVAGRTVVVIGVSSPTAAIAADHARHAEAIGADAVMAMPPTFHAPRGDELRAFYRDLSAATKLPVILQNAIGPGATPMSPETMFEIACELPRVRYIKEETAFPPQTGGRLLALAGDLVQVMGGLAGRTFMEEYPRGFCGTMPACEIADVHVALWNALEAGQTSEARRIFRHLLPLLDFERSYGIPLCKEVLKRRGVIASAAWRQTGCLPLDKVAGDELDAILGDLTEFMLPAWRPQQS